MRELGSICSLSQAEKTSWCSGSQLSKQLSQVCQFFFVNFILLNWVDLLILFSRYSDHKITLYWKKTIYIIDLNRYLKTH